jgi:hypothetical protein
LLDIHAANRGSVAMKVKTKVKVGGGFFLFQSNNSGLLNLLSGGVNQAGGGNVGTGGLVGLGVVL